MPLVGQTPIERLSLQYWQSPPLMLEYAKGRLCLALQQGCPRNGNPGRVVPKQQTNDFRQKGFFVLRRANQEHPDFDDSARPYVSC